MADSDSDDSFHSIHEEEEAGANRFTPEEETTLLNASNDLKTTGNQQFGSASYTSAIQTYDRALAQCPNYLDYELAVLHSNIAACHLQLSEWKEAIASAEKGIEGLERVAPVPKPTKAESPQNESDGKAKSQKVEELKDDNEEGEGKEGTGTVSQTPPSPQPQPSEQLTPSPHPLPKIRKLQIKLLLRRAKASTNLSTWSSLQSASEDYTFLLTSPALQPHITPTDKTSILQAQKILTPKLNAAKEKEMAEMMGKLKGLGNSILKPFGLSTENFKFEQQEGGGYAMNFDQGAGRK